MKADIIFDYSALKQRINDSTLSYTEIADKINIGRSTLYNKLNGVSQLSQQDIIKLAKLLSIPGDQLKTYFFASSVRKTVQQ